MKKVLFVTRPISLPWDEASKNFTRDLASRLKKVLPVTLTDHRLDELPNNVEQLELYTGDELNNRQKMRLINLRAYLKRSKVAVIHFLFTPTRMNSFFLKVILPCRRYKTIQSVATIDFKRYSSRQLRKILFADQIVTYSDYSRERLADIGINNVKTIYPGIDLKRFIATEKDHVLQAALGISDEHFVVVYPGEYTRLGDAYMLIDVLPQLVAVIPNLKFVFACRMKCSEDVAKLDEIKQFTARTGLDKYVVHTGTVKDIPALYSLANMVVFPVAKMDGKFDVPLAVIEAMASVKPVLISDLPVLAEFASPENTMVVKAGDADDYLSKFITLATDQGLQKKLAVAARRYVEDNYDIDKVAAKYDTLYQQLVESR